MTLIDLHGHFTYYKQFLCLHANNSLVKFADDTYLVVPAKCTDSRAVELDNIAAWAAKNNLQLNKLKTQEVVFHESRRRHSVQPPPLLPDVARDQSINQSEED